MTGIYLLIVVALWICICIVLTRALLHRLPIQAWRLPVGATVFVALLVAPVGDEIVGGFQFRSLCEKNAVFQIGVEKTEGRIARFSSNPSNEIVPGTAITIYHTGIEYTDVQSGEIVVKFDRYAAKGGVLIRALGISESNSPITMGRHACSPEQARGESVHRTLNFSVVHNYLDGGADSDSMFCAHGPRLLSVKNRTLSNLRSVLARMMQTKSSRRSA